MTALAWLSLVALALTLAAQAAAWCYRRAGRTLDAILAELPPDQDEVADLTAVLTEASQPGVSMPGIALAVLRAGWRRHQQGGTP